MKLKELYKHVQDAMNEHHGDAEVMCDNYKVIDAGYSDDGVFDILSKGGVCDN